MNFSFIYDCSEFIVPLFFILSYTQLGTGHNGVDLGLTGNFSQFNNMEVSAESTNLFSTLESADNYRCVMNVLNESNSNFMDFGNGRFVGFVYLFL